MALGTQALHAHGGSAQFSSERLSAAIPTHAITLQGSVLFHTGDRQRVLAAVEGKLDDQVRGTVLQMTCERREDRTEDWIWLCDLTVVAMEGVHPRGPGLLLRRKPSGGGARIALPDDYTPLTLESAELDELYDVRLAAGCDEIAAREALTPAMIAWLCERAPEALVVETGGASVRLATAATLATDEELDAFAADACWLAHAFVDAAARRAPGRLTSLRARDSTRQPACATAALWAAFIRARTVGPSGAGPRRARGPRWASRSSSMNASQNDGPPRTSTSVRAANASLTGS